MENPEPPPVGTSPTIAFWMPIQTILNGAANIAKLFWSSGKNRERASPERAPLRASLAITDRSILHDTYLRNDFEHVDERLEAWCKSGATLLVGRNVGETDGVHIAGETPQSRLGHFDHVTGVVEFLEHSVSLPDLIAEISDLRERTVAILRPRRS